MSIRVESTTNVYVFLDYEETNLLLSDQDETKLLVGDDPEYTLGFSDDDNFIRLILSTPIG